jgi:predicted metalloprotease with PDZ domain
VAAKYYKCWELGFRVKDLTYEVRRYFSIKDDQNGVIVYQVESGSKAAVAELGSYYIIVKVNGVAVNDSDHIKELLNKAIDEDPSETVNIEVLSYGETRFFEIRKPSKDEIAKIREEHKFDPEDEAGGVEDPTGDEGYDEFEGEWEEE